MKNNNYEIVKGIDEKGIFIRIRSTNTAKHFAVYRTFTKRVGDNFEENTKITEEIINDLIDSIKTKGITEGFILDFDKNNKLLKIKIEYFNIYFNYLINNTC